MITHGIKHNSIIIITSSNCGKTLNQISRTETLLRSCLSQTLHQNKWHGVDKMSLRHKSICQVHGHTNLKAHASGFFVHSEKDWLGASPHVHVFDPDVTEINGIAELK